jgi:hypothetical protein
MLVILHHHGFTQFHAPLVKRWNIPNGGLGKDFVLVKCNKLPKAESGKVLGE